jgi:hypothetical protein
MLDVDRTAICHHDERPQDCLAISQVHPRRPCRYERLVERLINIALLTFSPPRPPANKYGLKRDCRKLNLNLLHLALEDYSTGVSSVSGGGVRSGGAKIQHCQLQENLVGATGQRHCLRQWNKRRCEPVLFLNCYDGK